MSTQFGRQKHTQQPLSEPELAKKTCSITPQSASKMSPQNIHQGGNVGVVLRSRHIESSTRPAIQSARPLASLRSAKPKSSQVEQSASSSRDLAYLHRFLPDKGRDIKISRNGNLVRHIRHTRKYAKKSAIDPHSSWPSVFRLGGLFYSDPSKLSSHTMSGGAIKSSTNFNHSFSRPRSVNELPEDVDCFIRRSQLEGLESTSTKCRPQDFDRG